MASRMWTFVWATILVARTYAWDFVSPTELESRIKAQDTLVVAFVSPSEEKSGALETPWEEAASASPFPFLSIDCTADDQPCRAYDSTVNPSVKLIKDGHTIATYEGPRRASAISAWAARAQRPSVTDVPAESLAAFQGIDETVFVAYVDSTDADSRSAFEVIASGYNQEFTFGVHVLAGQQNTEDLETPSVKCYRTTDGDTKTLTVPFDQKSLDTFVKEASRPIIGELLPHTHQRFLDRGWPMVYVFAVTETERAELRDTLKKMARSYYESLTMVTVDPLDFPELPAKLGLEAGSFPAGAVHQLSNNRVFPYPKGQPITPRALQQWGLDVWQGRVQAWQPAGAIPAPKQDAPGRIKASRKVSMRSFPGMKINVGRDEL
ncbi:hypothetical protein SUNI508_09119 [Seiridium unicorne]|uniref:Protein disulfide-isomerase n=1 Tax=Seiridium unicorne TaxID=138068 RepID=A0ABR2US14_9PEZI